MALAAEVMVRISAQAERFNRTLKQVEKSLDRLERKARNVSTGTIAAFAAVSPAIAPVGAAAIGAAGGLAVAFGAAGAAVAGFGAVAVSNLNDVFEVSEDLEKINERIAKAEATGASAKQINKLMKERAFIMSQLSREQQRAAQALASFKSFWDDFASSFEKPVVDIFISSLRALQSTLTGLKPAFAAGMSGISALMNSVSQFTQTKEFQSFLQWIGQQAGPAIQSFGTIAGDVFRGFMNLLMAFTPLTADMQNGLVSLSEKFLQWTQSLENSQGFQTFINYIRTNGPKIVQILGQLGQILSQFAIAMAPIGAIVLDLALKFLTWFNNLLKTHPQLATLIVVGFQLIGVFRLVSPAVTTVINAFNRFGPPVLNAVKIISSATGKIIARMALMAGRALLSAARMALSWIIAMGPVGWVIAAVVALAILIIANWDKIKAWTIKAWNAISAKVKEAWQKLKQYVKDGIEKAKQAVKDGVNKIKSTVSEWASAGKDLILGLVDGIKSKAKSVVDAAVNAAKDAVKAVKDWLGISSPAKMTIEMGQDFGAGFAIGISDMIRQAQLASQSLARSSVKPLRSAQAESGGGQQIVNNFYVDDRNIANSVVRAQQRELWLYG